MQLKEYGLQHPAASEGELGPSLESLCERLLACAKRVADDTEAAVNARHGCQWIPSGLMK